MREKQIITLQLITRSDSQYLSFGKYPKICRFMNFAFKTGRTKCAQFGLVLVNDGAVKTYQFELGNARGYNQKI